jgi:hypothetical protein
MDPLTLFALANGAVSAVKAGCKLYKDIKGAAGEVKEVLKDLDQQFQKLHPPDKPATVAQKNAYIEEKNRVIDLNKKANSGQHTSVYQEIGEHLGTYYDNFHKCMAVFAEEEKRAKTQVYSGDDSIGKRALNRVLMRKQLQQMEVELRELMVYQSPPELGALYTEVEAMMKEMGAEQRILIAAQMQVDEKKRLRRQRMMDRYFVEGVAAMGTIIILGCIIAFMFYVVQDRIEKYPHLGTGWIPKSEQQQRKEALSPVYIGR